MGESETKEFVFAKRVHSMVYVLLSNKYATLKELRDDYTIDEALDLYEICLVALHNKAMSFKRGG